MELNKTHVSDDFWGYLEQKTLNMYGSIFQKDPPPLTNHLFNHFGLCKGCYSCYSCTITLVMVVLVVVAVVVVVVVAVVIVVVVVVMVVVMVMVVCWWWRIGGGCGGDSLCKCGSSNS